MGEARVCRALKCCGAAKSCTYACACGTGQGPPEALLGRHSACDCQHLQRAYHIQGICRQLRVLRRECSAPVGQACVLGGGGQGTPPNAATGCMAQCAGVNGGAQLLCACSTAHLQQSPCRAGTGAEQRQHNQPGGGRQQRAAHRCWLWGSSRRKRSLLLVVWLSRATGDASCRIALRVWVNGIITGPFMA